MKTNDFAVQFSHENVRFGAFARWYFQIDSIEFDSSYLRGFGFDDGFPFCDLEATGVEVRSTLDLFGLISAMWFINPDNVRLDLFYYDNDNTDEAKIRWTAPNGVLVSFSLPLWADKEYDYSDLLNRLNA